MGRDAGESGTLRLGGILDNIIKDISETLPENALETEKESNARVWAVGGGKGGVGKTLITANLAVTLARSGAKVIAIDLDLGGANLHTCLGTEAENLPCLTDFFEKRVSSIRELVQPTSIENLAIISGAADAVSIANLAHAQKQKLLSKIRTLEADYILLDLGAGTSFNTLDFFLFADVGILTVLPEPTSVENAYRFVKSIFYRKLKLAERDYNVRNLIDSIMHKKEELQINTPADLLRQIERENPLTGGVVREAIGNFDLKFILNQVRTQADSEIGYGIRNVCRKYFGVNIDYLGHLEYDSAVWQSVRRRRPLAVEFPSSPIMPKIQTFVSQMLNEEAERMQRKKVNV